MKLSVIDTGFFKLDGGAMFGVVPKVLWQKSIAADENNLVNWSMRCLLIETGNRLILIDTGMGNKQSPKFFSHYYLSNTTELKQAVRKAGYDFSEITDVFLTHLHFDHCGGAVEQVDEKLSVTFPNATYWSNQSHWDWATTPNPRERASFLSENIEPIAQSGQLKMINPSDPTSQVPFDVIFMDGHTEKQMLPVLSYRGRKLVFMADLLPSTAHIPLPYVMGYDVRPLQTMEEKNDFLNRAADENFVLFLEHDGSNECCTVKRGEKGVVLDQVLQLAEL